MRTADLRELAAMPAGTVFSWIGGPETAEPPFYCTNLSLKGESSPMDGGGVGFTKLELLPQPLRDANGEPRVCRCRHAADDWGWFAAARGDDGDRVWIWDREDVEALRSVLPA